MDLRRFMERYRRRVMFNGLFISIMLGALVAGYAFLHTPAHSANSSGLTADEAFTRAAQETGVPIELLKAICYTEGRLSNNSGLPSRDAGFGCMHLVKNGTVNTLDKAAVDLGVSVAALKQDMPTNIRGGAAILRDEALQLSPGHTLPANLSDWYNTLLVYSTSSNHDVAGIFANEIYKTIQRGFHAPTDKGEIVNLPAEQVQLNVANTATLLGNLSSSTLTQPGQLSTQKSPEGGFINTVTRLTDALPSTCANGQTDSNVDYPGAIDCLLSPPTTYDCNNLESPGNCNYTGSDRPTSCSVFVSPSAPLAVTQPCNVDQIVIHDTDSSLASTLNEFLCLGNNINDPTCVQSSAHYIIDTDGTVYQVVHEHDIAYHDGNFWSNMHSIGIEHVGFDATGYLWYNTAQYTASAKLVASLLKKYHLPLDRDHVVAHGTVPSPTLASSPNHVDPGPYWLWDYYFHLINQRGVPLNS
ncbi:MAG TPA: peptidoglycan recognition family protein, partial [Ktedonobacteraceae bacterium]|nr:peptidoglycan recognition family protein [Ktedonobacteraceae bacterium]